MKVSLIVTDLSSNPIVRAYPIAKVLQRRFDVEVLGLCFGEGLFPAYKDELNYKAVAAHGLTNPLKAMSALYKLIDGDLVYAFKPHLTSFGIGLLAKKLHHKHLVLDIEDFEIAPFYKTTHHQLQIRKQFFLTEMLIRNWGNPLALRYQYLMDKLTRFADQITVVSTFLQGRYGGTRLPHGTDTSLFDPERYNRQQCREKLGIRSHQTVILFAGTPRPHKGLEILAESVNRLSQKHGILLMVVGGSKNSPEIERLTTKYSDSVFHIESQPHTQMPYFLSTSDLVVLPQKDDWVSRAQVPGKIFEAMSMGKPIVASRVSDLPEILEGCGIVFEPGNTSALTQILEDLSLNKVLREELGHKAREKCLKYYSWDEMEKILVDRVLTQWL